MPTDDDNESVPPEIETPDTTPATHPMELLRVKSAFTAATIPDNGWLAMGVWPSIYTILIRVNDDPTPRQLDVLVVRTSCAMLLNVPVLENALKS